MEPIELQSRASARPERRVLLVALALALTAIVSLTVVGESAARTRVANEGGAHGANARDVPTLDEPVEAPAARVTTQLDSTTTTVPRTTTTVVPTRIDMTDDPAGSFDDPGPPVVPDPKIVQFKLARKTSYPEFLVVGPDGAIWFAEQNTRTIGRITTTGDITEYQLTDPFMTPVDIVVGPDNALWFNDANSPYLGRITTSGEVTKYHTGWHSYLPLAAGADGALWFSTSLSLANPDQNPHLARLTLDGELTLFPLGHYALYNLVVGPDGNLWATDPGFGLLRVTPAGVATSFVPDRELKGGPHGLTRGPDGRLWFGYGGNDGVTGVGYLTTTGTFGYLPLPADVGVLNLVVGPDEAIWFTSDYMIGRLTMSGELTTFDVKRPIDIIVGPDGNIWFANDLGAAIGRIRVEDV